MCDVHLLGELDVVKRGGSMFSSDWLVAPLVCGRIDVKEQKAALSTVIANDGIHSGPE